MTRQAEITNLHEEAMSFAEEAFVEQRKGGNGTAHALFFKAFLLEKKAALLMANESESIEPSRSVLFQSAASLAFNANLLAEAEQMILLGLSTNTPEPIASELRQLLTKITSSQEITSKTELSKKASLLPASLQKEVELFIEFLLKKHNLSSTL